MLPVVLRELAGTVLESLPWWRQGEKAVGRTNPAALQPQNWDYEVAHTNTHPIYELLKCVKGPDLQIQNYRVSMTQGINRISRRSSGEGPILIEKQKPETLSQTNIDGNEHLKIYGLRGILCDSLGHTTVSTLRKLFLFCFLFWFFCFARGP